MGTKSESVRWWLSSLDKADLSVTYAEQFPRYPRYSVGYDHVYPELNVEEQKKKHWPDKGEKIYYEVHVKNVGMAPSGPTETPAWAPAIFTGTSFKAIVVLICYQFLPGENAA